MFVVRALFHYSLVKETQEPHLWALCYERFNLLIYVHMAVANLFLYSLDHISKRNPSVIEVFREL